MPKARISRELNDGVYFLTPTIWNWYYIFDRHDRWSILANSLLWFQKNRQLKIHAYVFMLNHLHLIVSSQDVAGFLRDFKKFTSKELRRSLAEHEPNVLPLFVSDGGSYHFWKADNKPMRIESPKFYRQKLDYIHQNPVKKGYVMEAAHWKWSSANPDSLIVVEPLV